MKITRMMKLGERLYDVFCSKYPETRVCIPRTNTYERFGLLSKYHFEKQLTKEMMEEFCSNLPDTEYEVIKGKLYEVYKGVELVK